MRIKLPPTGFTLIELLVVIAVIGVLAGAIVVIINPAATLDRARIAKGKSFHGNLTRTLGFYNVGAWDFNDASNPAKDSSGNNNNGIVTGATYVPTCDLGFGGCYSFDGTDDQIISSGVDLTTGNWTMSAWIYPTAYGSQWRRVFATGATGGYGFGIASGTLRVTVTNISDAPASTIAPPLNKWTHIIATFIDSTSSLTYYVDGAKANTVTYATAPTAGVKTRYIGGDYAGTLFQGQIDETYIFNQELSQAMIEKYYAKSAMKHYLATLEANKP